MRLTAFGVVALIAGSACGPQTAAAPPASEVPVPLVIRDRDVIGRDELTRSSVVNMTVLDAVRTLRPNFLAVRGKNTVTSSGDQESGMVHASIDGNKIVPIQELDDIRAGNIAEVRFLAPGPAMQRFGGSAHGGPVILVKLM